MPTERAISEITGCSVQIRLGHDLDCKKWRLQNSAVLACAVQTLTNWRDGAVLHVVTGTDAKMLSCRGIQVRQPNQLVLGMLLLPKLTPGASIYTANLEATFVVWYGCLRRQGMLMWELLIKKCYEAPAMEGKVQEACLMKQDDPLQEVAAA